MRERIVYYGTKLITEQLQSGNEYDLIKKTISIVIAGEIFLTEHNEYHDVFTLYSRVTGTEFTDILEIHTLELPKLPAEADGSELWTWLEFINAESEEELKMLVKREPKMKLFVERLLELNRDPATRALYEAREKDRRDSRGRERYAMQKGKAEGIAEGIAEGRLEIARKMKNAGRPLNEITEFTGLPTETIERM
jgi:predicted transposase/invertase (TIGR01784 family)